MNLPVANSNELSSRREAINIGRISHLGETDPNEVIIEYDKTLQMHKKAASFLLYRNKWEAARRGEKRFDYPLEVDFAFNNRCIIQCPHCYLQFQPQTDSNVQMPLLTAKSLIKESKEIGAHSVFLGNDTEFFVYKHADEILQFASDLEFEDLILASNGILLNQKRITDILNSNVTRLYISVDALTKETYEKVRSEWYYKVMINILSFLAEKENCKKTLPILRLSFIDYSLNHHERDDFVKFWKRNGVNEVDVQELIDVNNVNELKYPPETQLKPEEGLRCSYPETMIYINWNGD